MRTWLLLLALSAVASAQLRGAYTIDPARPPSGTNYQTFAAAIDALRAGVGANVTFKVASTTFREALAFRSINGVSQTATITFEADGAPAVIDAGNHGYAIHFHPNTRWLRFTNLRLTGYVNAGLFLEGRGGQPGLTDSIFSRCDVDDGQTFWPSIRALWMQYSGDRNRFVDCTFRASGMPVQCAGALGCAFERCELDGKGTATRIAEIRWSATSRVEPACMITNCVLHGAAPTGQGLYYGSSSKGLIAHNTIIANTNDVAAALGGTSSFSQGWAHATVFRNNIVVNRGPGFVVSYSSFWRSSTPAVLTHLVSDNNCFYGPNTNWPILVGSTTFPMFAGSLAQFLAWQAADPTRIPSGGPAAFDANTVTVDPRLASLTTPDPHLRADSPLRDAGVANLVPVYVQIGAPTVTVDFEGEQRIAAPDIGADEVSFSLRASGAERIGTTMRFDLSAQLDPTLQYQLGTSFGTGPILIGNRFLRLNLDSLLMLSISGLAPTVFEDYRGTLDPNGKGVAKLHLPNLQQLIGLDLFTAFVTLSATAPNGVKTISNTHVFKVQ